MLSGISKCSELKTLGNSDFVVRAPLIMTGVYEQDPAIQGGIPEFLAIQAGCRELNRLMERCAYMHRMTAIGAWV